MVTGNVMAPSIVCCLDYTDVDSLWITQKLSDTGFNFAIVRCTPKSRLERYLKIINLARVRGGFESAVLAKKLNAKALISIGPSATAWCALFCFVFGVKTKIVAHAFNFVSLPRGLKRLFFHLTTKRISRFTVFSTIEKEVYSTTFGVPVDRFDFIFCDAEPREINQTDFSFAAGNYVSVIGGNARDFRILLDAARELPQQRFELVVRPESLKGLRIPENVRVHVNLPFDLTMNILLHSQFMVLPLLDSTVPCGHVTIVCAMHLGKAVIVTGSTGIADYVRDGINGLTVPAGDKTALLAAIKRLTHDHLLCARLGQAGQRFAKETCSEKNTISYFHRLCAELYLA
jgi:glycosyltransferase involved in cell wall biosynthesis